MKKENSPAHVRSSTRTVFRSRGGISADGRSPCTEKCSQEIKYARRRWQSRGFKRRGDTRNTPCSTQHKLTRKLQRYDSQYSGWSSSTRTHDGGSSSVSVVMMADTRVVWGVSIQSLRIHEMMAKYNKHRTVTL